MALEESGTTTLEEQEKILNESLKRVNKTAHDLLSDMGRVQKLLSEMKQGLKNPN